MKKKVWIINHYATDMYKNKGGRHFWFAENLLKKNYQPIIFCANTYHNKKEFPEFDDLTTMHCNIVRDADKVDIMDMQVNELDRYDYEYPIDILDSFKKQ